MASFAPDIREALAREVHADYVRRVREIEGPLALARPETAPWDELSEEYREASRRQVDDIDDKAARIGAVIVPAGEAGGLFIFSSEEMELLSEREHDRWMAERLGQGWTRGEVRDPVSRSHPSLVPYADLSDAEREKDRDAVRRIPTLLAMVGLAISRDDAE